MKPVAPHTLWRVLSACLLLLFLASLLAGRVWLDPAQVLAAFRAPDSQLASLIVLELRLPRAVLACLVGAALGLSGAVLQGLTRNPLAEPGLMGVSSGAALGAVIASYTGLATAFPLATPLLGLLGAFVAALLTLSLGRGGGVLVLILSGAAVSGLMFAGTALALNLAPNPYAAYEISMWLMGSLADKSWDHVLLAAPFMVLGLLLLLGTGRALDALSLGEVQAESLGVDLRRLRLPRLDDERVGRIACRRHGDGARQRQRLMQGDGAGGVVEYLDVAGDEAGRQRLGAVRRPGERVQRVGAGHDLRLRP